MLPELLDVLDQVLGVVALELGEWRRAAASPLVEQRHVEEVGIVGPPVRRPDAAAGAAMQEQRRHALGIADPLEMKRVAVVDGELAGLPGLDLGKQRMTFEHERSPVGR